VDRLGDHLDTGAAEAGDTNAAKLRATAGKATMSVRIFGRAEVIAVLLHECAARSPKIAAGSAHSEQWEQTATAGYLSTKCVQLEEKIPPMFVAGSGEAVVRDVAGGHLDRCDGAWPIQGDATVVRGTRP
jgi:hypothetical protein